jgi:hypothetical protein
LKLLRVILLAALVGALIGWLCGGEAEADHQITFSLPGYGELSQYNPVIRELRTTGVFRWRCVTDPGAPNGCPIVIQALDEYSQRYGVLMLYDPDGTPLVSSAGNAFAYGNVLHGGCGLWAIGCVSEFPGDPEVVVDVGTSQVWSLRSQLEVWLHELMHTLANAAEGYQEDYVYGATACAPIDDRGAFPGIHRSIMNCGPFNSQYLDQYADVFWTYSHWPQPVAGAALSAGVVWYAATSYQATRVAVLADSGGGVYLVGYGQPCTSAGWVCGSYRLPVLLAGTRIYVKAENALSWQYAFTEVYAGEVK